MSILENATRLAYTTFSFMRKNLEPIVRKSASCPNASTINSYFSSSNERQPSPIHMKKLLQEMDKLTAGELGLDVSMRELGRSEEPFTYIDILDGMLISIGIFVLHPGAKIYLHDHPRMFGIIKVIHGELKIQSYSYIMSTSTASSNSAQVSESNVLIVEEKPEVIANKSSSPLVLTPIENNYHQIEYVKGENNEGNYAAFIDFLVPPYSVDGPDCNYYKAKTIPADSPLLKSLTISSTTKKLLQLIKAPELSQMNNSAYYYGPSLNHLKIELIDL